MPQRRGLASEVVPIAGDTDEVATVPVSVPQPVDWFLV